MVAGNCVKSLLMLLSALGYTSLFLMTLASDAFNLYTYFFCRSVYCEIREIGSPFCGCALLGGGCGRGDGVLQQDRLIDDRWVDRRTGGHMRSKCLEEFGGIL